MGAVGLHHGRDDQRALRRDRQGRRRSPAMLYFFTVFWMVHLEGRPRRAEGGCRRRSAPTRGVAIRARWYLLLPLVGLVYLLFAGFTPMFAGMVGLALTVVLLFGSSLARHLNGTLAAPAVLDRARPWPARPSPRSGSSRWSRWWRCSRCCSRAARRWPPQPLRPGGEGRWWTARCTRCRWGVACALVGRDHRAR
jgi:hypothetical protein